MDLFSSGIATGSMLSSTSMFLYSFFLIHGRQANKDTSQVFCNTPKFEELNKAEKELYHDDKDMYNKLSRKSGKGLLYAKSGEAGETWVPLFEKAYAKLHGDYASLSGGRSSEGIEDLTGCVIKVE
jgi:hypothetical protein